MNVYMKKKYYARINLHIAIHIYNSCLVINILVFIIETFQLPDNLWSDVSKVIITISSIRRCNIHQ